MGKISLQEFFILIFLVLVVSLFLYTTIVPIFYETQEQEDGEKMHDSISKYTKSFTKDP